MCRKDSGNPHVGGLDSDLTLDSLDETRTECGPHRIILYHAVGVKIEGKYISSSGRPVIDELDRARRFQLMARNMAALIPKLPGGTPGIYDFGRAGGNAVCERCGLEYVEHPTGLEEFLHLLCDGKQVKL